jgi:mitochondrial splicing suppressor protein 51
MDDQTCAGTAGHEQPFDEVVDDVDTEKVYITTHEIPWERVVEDKSEGKGHGSPSTCSHCSKTAEELGHELKRCAKCKNARYCSHECQKAEWKTHKKVCGKNVDLNGKNTAINTQSDSEVRTPRSTNSNTPSNSSSRSASPSTKNLKGGNENGFHRLETRTWLHDRPETDVYKLLIDTYRLRQEDDCKFTGVNFADSIYSGEVSFPASHFRKFLKKAKTRPDLLPSWWNAEKENECIEFGRGKEDTWANLAAIVEKADIIEHYGNPLMPMQLRMLGEQIYGAGPMGHNGKGMRQLMMAVERGEINFAGCR